MVKREEKEILTLDDLKETEKAPIETKHYVDASGNYLGGFATDDPAVIPFGAVEIPEPPEHGNDRLVDGKWDKSSRPEKERSDLELAVIALLSGDINSYHSHLEKLTA